MPGFLVHVGATILCPHAGQASVVSANTRVMVSNQQVALVDDNYPIAGCPFVMGNTPHPCVKIQWTVPATRVFVNKKPVILQASSGLCLAADQMPQGPPNIVMTQIRVKGM